MKKIYTTILATLFFITNYSAEASSLPGECRCSYADLVAPLIPAVVNISTSKKVPVGGNKLFPHFPPGSPFEEFNQFFERFGIVPPNFDEEENENQELRPYSAGSGFIIDKAGYIVTNHHVVAEAEKITVTLSNDKKYEAQLIGSDSRTDLALLKMNTKEELTAVKFGNSDESRVGDTIIAIGNPFGLGGTITTGIISARSRDIGAGTTSLVDNYLQTDAAINKGNSGGPMFNMKGEVIGINTAIYSPSGGNIGIGFAVPSSLAEPVIAQIKKSGKVIRGWLGVTIQSTEDIAEGLGIKDNVGALVVAVATNSPAAKAGINVGDIILKFDGREVTNNRKLPRIVAETPVGKNVTVELMSKGKVKTIILKLVELDEKSERQSYGKKGTFGNLEKKDVDGISIADLNDDIRRRFNIPQNISGIIVTGVKKNSNASRSGIKAGDIIIAVNQEHISDIEQFEKLLEDARSHKKNSVMLWINRNGVNVFLQLPIIK